MAEFPALPLWTDAWVADTHHLTRVQRGTYHDLLVLMWRSPQCRVPNDDGWLAARLHMSPAEVQDELRPIIREFCKSDGNWITQKRLLKEFQYVRGKRKLQSERAKSRWEKQKSDARAYAGSGNAPTPTPTPTPLKKIKPQTPFSPAPPPPARGRGRSAPDPARMGDFRKLWAAVLAVSPHPGSRLKAERVFVAITDSPAVADLIGAYREYADDIRKHNENRRFKQRVQHLHSWLRDRMYETYLADARNAVQSEAQQRAAMHDTIAHWNGRAQPLIDSIGIHRFAPIFGGSQVEGATVVFAKSFQCDYVQRDSQIMRLLTAQFGEKLKIISQQEKRRA